MSTGTEIRDAKFNGSTAAGAGAIGKPPLRNTPRLDAKVRQLLGAAEAVVACDLTLIECDRVLLRAATLGELTEAEAADRRAHLTMAASHWHVLRIGPEIVERARQPSPGEPIRTLDAIHLASALVARAAVPGLELLSLGDRIRKAGRRVGLRVRPE
jgi:predicted nucleic acid-binding protein